MSNLAIDNPWDKQLNAFDESVNKAPNAPPLLTLFSIFQLKQSNSVVHYNLYEIHIVCKKNFCQSKNLIVNSPFIYLGYVRKDAYWPIILFRRFGFLFINWCNIANFKSYRNNKNLSKQ